MRAPSQTPLQPHPYYVTTGLWLSDATSGPDRAQLDLLCPPTRAGGAALRGRTIIATQHAPAVMPRQVRADPHCMTHSTHAWAAGTAIMNQ